MNAEDPRNITTLLSDVLDGLTALLRQEVDLARAEVDQSLRRASVAIGFILCALLAGLVALSVLSSAVIAALVLAGLSQIWATLAVGLGLLAIASVLVFMGMRLLKQISLAPRRVADSLRQDASIIKDAYNDR